MPLVSRTRSTIFSPHSRQGGGAQVDGARVDLDGDPAVLRYAPLGDVDIGHDLQPGDQRRLHVFGHRVDLVQDPVDAVAHPHAVLAGLQVQVGGAVDDGLLDERVDVPDDGRVFVDRRQVGDARRRLGAQALGHLAEVVLLALQPVDDLAKFGAGDHHRAYRQSGGGPHVIQGQDVTRVGDADGDPVLVEGDAEHPVLEDERHRDLGDHGRVDRVTDQVQRGDAVGIGGRLGQLLLGDHVVVDEDGADRSAGACSLFGRLVDRFRIRTALLQRVQQWTERLVHLTPVSLRDLSAAFRVSFGFHPGHMDRAR
jgi:hypothetical protein